MPGPEIQASAVVTALAGFPLDDAPAGSTSLLIVAARHRSRRSPRCALRIFVALGFGLARARRVPRRRPDRLQPRRDRLRRLPGSRRRSRALLATAAIHGVTVAFEREQARDAFARFVPEAVVDEVLRSADGIRLGGVQREGTVMFSDLRGFTSFAETLEPATVIGVLNRYLTAMSEAILDHGGTLVAYMGDGIMAVFGAPLQQDDHADRALAAARDMLDRLEGFNDWLREEGLHEGFKMGIGLNSGQVMSGHVGSERRLEYTALGDTTNTAARLEGMTKGTPYQLYVADSTRSRLSQPPRTSSRWASSRSAGARRRSSCGRCAERAGARRAEPAGSSARSSVSICCRVLEDVAVGVAAELVAAGVCLPLAAAVLLPGVAGVVER